MSTFLGASSGFGFLAQSDERVMPSWYVWVSKSLIGLRPWRPGVLWSRSNGLGGQFGFVGPGIMDQDSGPWYVPTYGEDSGGQQAKKLIGTTLDANGTPLGNCIVQGFVTATDVFVGQVTSDPAGYYELPTRYGAVAHYIVAYKAGSPDLAGTSVNTLIPV